MALVKAGVPFDLAFSMDEDWRRALCIVAGENEGGEFDWSSMSWKEPQT
jgi:hypothetical protein